MRSSPLSPQARRCLTARQGRQTIDAAERSRVEVQALRDQSGTLRLALINSGRGTARGVAFLAHANGRETSGPIGDAFVAAGERAHVFTDIPMAKLSETPDSQPADLAVMVLWRDAEGFAHFRTHTEVERVPRTLIRRRPKYPGGVEAFKELYPDIAIDGAKPAAYRVERVEPT